MFSVSTIKYVQLFREKFGKLNRRRFLSSLQQLRREIDVFCRNGREGELQLCVNTVDCNANTQVIGLDHYLFESFVKYTVGCYIAVMQWCTM